MASELIGHSGLTHRAWEDKAIADFMAGRRDRLPNSKDFNREFVADADGMMPPITAIINAVTGLPVELPEPIRVHIDDLDRVIAEYQQRFLDEWNARPKRRWPEDGLLTPSRPLPDPGRPADPPEPS